MQQRILIAGAGSPDVVRLIDDINSAGRDRIEVVGFLDDDPSKAGGEFMGYRILGPAATMLSRYSDCGVINNVARTMPLRWKVFQALRRLGVTEFPTLVHPGVGTRRVEIGPGCLVNEDSNLAPGVRVGAYSVLGVRASVSHETVIGECAFLATGSVLGARCVFGAGSFLGLNATVIPELRIGESVMVGAGAVVTRDVPDLKKAYGNPARIQGDYPPYRGEA